MPCAMASCARSHARRAAAFNGTGSNSPFDVVSSLIGRRPAGNVGSDMAALRCERSGRALTIGPLACAEPTLPQPLYTMAMMRSMPIRPLRAWRWVALLLVCGHAGAADEPRRNPFDDPFTVVTSGLPGCPRAEAPLFTEEQIR